MAWDGKVDVCLIGGGMISEEVVLPTVFQERLRGKVNRVSVCSLNAGIIKHLQEVFPKEQLTPYPDPAKEPLDKNLPELYKQAIADLGPHGLVIVATPDHLHTPMVMASLEAGYDVICMKPLCLKTEEAHQVMELANAKRLYVATDYHKRMDRAVRLLKRRYGEGELGEVLYGHAWIEEPKYMPLKFFKLWCEKSSSFEYIGVHYADVFYHVTGLLPKRVVAFGQKKFLPTKGYDAYDAIQAVVEWENGAALWIQTSWVCSDKNSSMTNQGFMMQGTEGEYWADHKARNLHILSESQGFQQINPNFFKHYDSYDEPGEVEYVGYGNESIVRWMDDIIHILKQIDGKSEAEQAKIRQAIHDEYVKTRPLPEQALVGVAINDAVRLSVDNGSKFVVFDDKLYPKLEQ